MSQRLLRLVMNGLLYGTAFWSIGAARSVAQPDRNALRFEVASIRENRSNDAPSTNVPLDRSDTYSPGGCTFRAINQPFVAYLIFAWKVRISEFRGGLMRSLPAWAVKDRFDIVAKCDSPNPAKDDLRLMLQSLLAERFSLKAHREDRQLPALAMYPGKPGALGPLLKVHASNCASPLPTPVASAATASLLGEWPPLCGDGEELRISRHRMREGGRAMTMDQIADWISGAGDLDLPVVNASGLKGTFDFVLEFVPDKLQDALPDPSSNEASALNFQEAVEDQLGMRLKKENATMTLFFVDRLLYPSPN